MDGGVTVEGLRAMRRFLNAEPTADAEYRRRWLNWFRAGFYYNEDGDILGWRDSTPRIGDVYPTYELWAAAKRDWRKFFESLDKRPVD